MRASPLGELARVVSGTTPPTDNPNNWDGDVVWVTPADLGQLADPAIKSSSRRITETARAGSRLELIPPGSVVMSSRAPIGHLGIASVDLCTNQGCKSFVPGPYLDGRYLYFLLKHRMVEIRALGAGATFAEVSKSTLERFVISIPSITEQRRIAVRLTAQLAAAASLAAQVSTQADQFGILAEALLGRAFGTGDLRRLGDVATIIRGVTFDGGEVRTSAAPDLIPILRAGNINQTLTVDRDLVWVPRSRVSPDQRLRTGDIAIALSSGSRSVVGKTAVLQRPFEGAVGAFCGIVRANSRIDASYLAYWFNSAAYFAWRNGSVRGASIQNLRVSELNSVLIPVPDMPDQLRVVAELRRQVTSARMAEAAAASRTAAVLAMPAALLREAFASTANIA